MATIKKSKVKNLSAGPSKKTSKAPMVDPKGQFTKVQERTLGNMKKGGKIKKAQKGIMERISNTKLKDVPGKAMNAGRRLVDKVKNATVGDVASAATMGLPGTIRDLSKLSKKSSSITKNLKRSAYKKGGTVKKGMHMMPDGSMMKNSMMKMGGKTKKK